MLKMDIHNRAVGYIISRKGIKKLLNKCKPIYSPIDNMIMNNIKIKILYHMSQEGNNIYAI